MKSGTPDLMKFKRLQRALGGESKRGTVGLLELLWLGTAKNAYRGDIGKFTNEEIAILIDWDGDSDLLIDALVETGWLDRDKDFNLMVHDWFEHAPKYVKGNIARHGKVKKTPSKKKPEILLRGEHEKTLPKGTSSPKELAPRRAENKTKKAPTKPNQTKPNQSTIDRGERSTEKLLRGESEKEIFLVTQDVYDSIRGTLQEIAEVVGKNHRLLPGDRELAIKSTIIARDWIGMEAIEDIIGAIRLKREPLERPWGYLKISMIKSCAKSGQDFHELWKLISVPDEFINPRKKTD